MLFNPFLRALAFQSRSVSMMAELATSCSSLRRTQLDCIQALFTIPQGQTALLATPVQSEAMQIEAAESEGMGTAILSAPRKLQAVVSYDAPCNVDAKVIEESAAVQDKPKSIRKWFSENAVAYEQDIIDDRIPNRRVYSAFGQAPNAPSAIAVLERYKQKIRAV